MGDREVTGTGFTRDQVALVADTAVNPFCAIDQSGTVVWASASVVEVLGIEASDLVGRSMLDFVAPESVEHAVRSLEAASAYVRERAGSRAWEGRGPVVRLRRTDGTEISCAVAVATPLRTGLPAFVLQLRRADAASALERALVAMGEGGDLPEVLDHVAAMLEGDLADAAVAVYRRYGARGSLEHVVGPAHLGATLDRSALDGTPWARALAEPGVLVERGVDDLPVALRTEAARESFRWLTVLGVEAGEGDLAAALVVWSRHEFAMHVFTHERVLRAGRLVGLVVQWERGQRALHWAATHDILTRLHNRSHFVEQVAAEAARPTGPAAAVLYLDLDGFKPVNDLYGHDVGDQALVAVALRLSHCVRPEDVVARLGGDEFAVLCRHLGREQVAAELAARLVEEVSEPIMVQRHEVQIGLTVGIAQVEPGEDPEDALARADAALRQAKRAGKNRWRVADPPDRAAPS